MSTSLTKHLILALGLCTLIVIAPALLAQDPAEASSRLKLNLLEIRHELAPLLDDNLQFNRKATAVSTLLDLRGNERFDQIAGKFLGLRLFGIVQPFPDDMAAGQRLKNKAIRARILLASKRGLTPKELAMFVKGQPVTKLRDGTKGLVLSDALFPWHPPEEVAQTELEDNVMKRILPKVSINFFDSLGVVSQDVATEKARNALATKIKSATPVRDFSTARTVLMDASTTKEALQWLGKEPVHLYVELSMPNSEILGKFSLRHFALVFAGQDFGAAGTR